MLKILHPIEQRTNKRYADGLFINNNCLPKSLLCHRPIRRLVYSDTVEARDIAKSINWEAFKCNVKGVRCVIKQFVYVHFFHFRWHPTGSWMVQFTRRNYEKNFFVNCRCYFRFPPYQHIDFIIHLASTSMGLTNPRD